MKSMHSPKTCKSSELKKTKKKLTKLNVKVDNNNNNYKNIYDVHA